MASHDISSIASHEGAGPVLPAKSSGGIVGLIKRVASGVHSSRQDRIEQEFGRQIAAQGGRLNDDLERRMDQILLSHGGC